MSLKLMARPSESAYASGASETIVVSRTHADFLERMSFELNPDTPAVFGLPHAIRALLEHFEDSGIDFTAASTEEEIAAIAAAELQELATEPLCASAPIRSEARRAYRSSRPVTGRRRSGTRPRSTRG